MLSHQARRSGLASIVTVMLLATALTLSGCGSVAREPVEQGSVEPGTVETGTVDSLKPGTTAQSLTIDGVQRSFILTVPEKPRAATPLVVMVHGGFGSAEQAEADYGWSQLAEAEGFIAVFPDGLGRAWNAGDGCCGRAASLNSDDVAFITAVTDWVAARAPLDEHRVFATGMSNGGMMAYRLACETDVFAAIGPVAATMLVDCLSPTAVSVMHIHGLSDESVRADGNAGTGRAVIDGPPLDQLHVQWQGINKCEQPSVVIEDAVTRSLAQCSGGRAVELITISNAGHQWPGAEKKPARGKVLGTDTPSTALDATTTLWDFFESHPRVGR